MFASKRIVLIGLLLGMTGCSGMFVRREDPTQTGLRLYQEGNYPEAAGAFRNAIREDERDYKAHYYLAVACDADHRYQEAIEAYRAALDVMKVTYRGQEDVAFRQKILDGFATTVAKSDTHDQELDQLERKARASNKAEDYFLVAKVYAKRGDADMALENYNHAALLDNKSFPILKEYGLYLNQCKLTDRAIAALEQAYRINDKDNEVNGTLTSLGVVVGPSIKERNELAQPAIPKGPIPPLNIDKIKSGLGLGGRQQQAQPQQLPAPSPTESPTPASSLQAPRD